MLSSDQDLNQITIEMWTSPSLAAAINQDRVHRLSNIVRLTSPDIAFRAIHLLHSRLHDHIDDLDDFLAVIPFKIALLATMSFLLIIVIFIVTFFIRCVVSESRLSFITTLWEIYSSSYNISCPCHTLSGIF